MNDQSILTRIMQLAALAGAEIMAIRAKGFTVSEKADATPVTAADMRAEAIITQGLRDSFPQIPVIAEEEVAAGRITPPSGEYWLVDPLDGTREFAAGRTEFAVNIGLIRNGVPVLGAVGAPAFDAVYGGIIGVGAWKNTSPIHTRAAPPEGLTVMASRHYAADPALAACLAAYKVAKLTNIGSALKFLALAEGQADYYPRLGRTMEWDTAAPQAVLEAAGGCVLTTDGSPLRYGKAGWENPNFFCWGKESSFL
jgi:3'(2'), 5'-bisphosphate nucleotidase